MRREAVARLTPKAFDALESKPSIDAISSESGKFYDPEISGQLKSLSVCMYESILYIARRPTEEEMKSTTLCCGAGRHIY